MNVQVSVQLQLQQNGAATHDPVPSENGEEQRKADSTGSKYSLFGDIKSRRNSEKAEDIQNPAYQILMWSRSRRKSNKPWLDRA